MDDYGDPSTAKASSKDGFGFYINSSDPRMAIFNEHIKWADGSRVQDDRPAEHKGYTLKHPACDEPRVATALDHQVGGDHYKHFKIQPAEFVEKNNLGFMLGNCVKYCCRYVEKGNPIDLEKAIHYIQMKMELERGGGT